MQSKAMVQSNGNVFWPPPAKLRSTCKIDITYFPFDDQSCTMKFGSWTYDGWQVNIIKRHDEVDTSNYVENGEWDLLKIVVERHEIFYPCCEEPYPDLRFTIYMRRRTLYYLFNIIFPCLWLTVLSLVSFWLPPDSGEKITLGITVLLAFSVFMLLIAENMPATSEFVPLIGVYLTVTMTMTSLSIILTVLVLHLHHTSSNRQPIPKYLRKFFFDIVAKFFCLNIVQRYQIKRNQSLKLTKRLKLITNQLHNDYINISNHSNNVHDIDDHHKTNLQSDYLPLNIVNSMNSTVEQQELLTTMIATSTTTSTTTATKYTEKSSCTHQIKQPSLINSKQYETSETLNHPHQYHVNQLNDVANEKTINPPQNVHILLNADYVTSNIEKQKKKISKEDKHYEMLHDYETISMIKSNDHLLHDSEANDPDHPDNDEDADDVTSSSASIYNQQVNNKPIKLQFLQNKQEQCKIMKNLLKILEKSKKQQTFLQFYLYYLYMKQSNEEQISDMINEWRILAIIVDRMLFWLFLTNAVIATIVILIIMPLFKPTLV
ncbi:Acetylcholine receptor subunit alpha-type acr-16 [Schistosoma japonicum]|nr:Acetylcholine receptor subunit alpha-type acr-16 [Schistosoma japonicum]